VGIPTIPISSIGKHMWDIKAGEIAKIHATRRGKKAWEKKKKKKRENFKSYRKGKEHFTHLVKKREMAMK